MENRKKLENKKTRLVLVVASKLIHNILKLSDKQMNEIWTFQCIFTWVRTIWDSRSRHNISPQAIADDPEITALSVHASSSSSSSSWRRWKLAMSQSGSAKVHQLFRHR